jgi:DNA-binding beta-propeller fold protein YncE
MLAVVTLYAAEELPTGKRITPTAAKGSLFEPLSPDLPPPFSKLVVDHAVTTAVSPNGNTLLILTSGYNSNNDMAGHLVASASNEYIFVYDISANPPVKRQALQVPNTFVGLAWNPDGNELYVSGGVDDNVHVFAKGPAGWAEAAPAISLGHSSGLYGLTPAGAAGLAVNRTGDRLVVANYENDSISVVDTRGRRKVAELDLRPGKNDPGLHGVAGGEYPFWVAIKGDAKVYVSSLRDREIVAVDISATVPRILGRVSVQGQPNKMILNKAQTLLYVSLDATDLVAIIDTAHDRVKSYFDATAPGAAFPNRSSLKGSNPNSLALSPDERTLYVTNGGTNSVAVVKLGHHGTRGRVAGLIPTGWYPESVSLNRQGSILYVVNGKSNAGPNPGACRNPHASPPCDAANQYVWQLTKAGFLVIPAPSRDELRSLTEQVAANNSFHGPANHEDDGVLSSLRGKIKHVIYVVKENRTYDQVLGDLDRGNGDPALAMFPEPVTPNFHQLARRFVTLDNFYDSGEVSGDGWNWSTSARTADSVEKTAPVNYANRGLSYDYEGANRNINVGLATAAARLAAAPSPRQASDPDLLPGTADVSAPDGPGGEAGTGYLWDAALRAHLTVRNYGFFIDLARYSLPAKDPASLSPLLRDPFAPDGTPFTPAAAGRPVQVAFAAKAALLDVTDPYFRGFDNKFPDFWRFKEWEREFDAYAANGSLPSLELVRLPNDHFGSFATAIDGVDTVETQMADNDYAVALLVERVANSPYKNDTVIFVIEDDAQDGPDHVDAHRSNAFVVGAYLKQGAVVSTRYSTVSVLRTIEDLLGIQPLSLNDGLTGPMAAVFQANLEPWAYSALVPRILRTTALPLPPPTPAETGSAYATPRHDAEYWESRTRGLDFTEADDLDTPRFNRILWEGLMGATPYPVKRSGADLRANRGRLLDAAGSRH